MSNKADIKIGSVVQLLSGGPQMSVTDIERMIAAERVTLSCAWFSGECTLRADFPREAVRIVAE